MPVPNCRSVSVCMVPSPTWSNPWFLHDYVVGVCMVYVVGFYMGYIWFLYYLAAGVPMV